ncbi:MAG: hypothetical protein IBJ03_18300 [Gemmatimonadaceae bacterium]|nr:hypothetical protein [Gemmatimonadaceae bacterium]
MDILGIALSTGPIAVGAFGTWLLVREVHYAHQFEAHSREMKALEEQLRLYRTDPREFWIQSAIVSFRSDRSKVSAIADSIDDETLNKEILQYQDFYERRVAKHLEWWNSSVAEGQLKRRQRMLWTGFLLLMLSAVAQAAQAMWKYL